MMPVEDMLSSAQSWHERAQAAGSAEEVDYCCSMAQTFERAAGVLRMLHDVGATAGTTTKLRLP